MITRTFPLLEAPRALELLAGGTVEGKIVLEAPSPERASQPLRAEAHP